MWIDQRGSEILQTPECLQLLAVAAKEDHVGRLAVIDGRSPLVVPLNFTFHDHTVFVLIGPGLLSMLVPGSLVAFEVDRVELDRAMAWSVLVRGLATKPQAEDSLPEAALPKPWVPQPGDELISIRPDVVTGRRFGLVATDGHGSEPGTSGVPTV